MLNFLSCIGVPINSQEDLDWFIKQIAQSVRVYRFPEGSYWRWNSTCGAEIWLQFDNESNLCDLVPYFRGDLRLKVQLTEFIKETGENGPAGACCAWNMSSIDGEDGSYYPFVFCLPDALMNFNLTLPRPALVSVAAFSRSAAFYASEEEFDDSQTGMVMFASQSFVPTGLLVDSEGRISKSPKPAARITGHVVDSKRRTNELTQKEYLWVRLRTYGGEYDVLLDPEDCPKLPNIGGILHGDFGLCGRILQTT